jgi:hypothetical protein
MSTSYIPLALRRLVYERAGGCCEYCLIPEAYVLAPHEVDHIIALKHDGKTEPSNMALSCTLCNKHKGSDLASYDGETGQIVPLYHPRLDRWADNFWLEDGIILPKTPVGRVTARLLQFNRSERVLERRILSSAGLLHIP